MSDDLPSVDLEAEGVVRCTCEFCGKVYWLDPNTCSVIHEMDPCAEFTVMEPLDFTVENRKIKERKVARA